MATCTSSGGLLARQPFVDLVVAAVEKATPRSYDEVEIRCVDHRTTSRLRVAIDLLRDRMPLMRRTATQAGR
jgi:hypothetical protein